MNKEFDKDFNRAYNFYKQHKAEIQEIFKHNRLFNVEFDSKELAKMFDLYAGIDYVVFQGKTKSLYGVASRINFNQNHHKHLTIRYKRASGALTEYQKRVSSILNKRGELYATIQMQIDAKKEVADSGEDKYSIARAIVLESDKLYMAINNDIDFFETKYLQ
ncbi:hypothetical protein EOM81_12325, partial [bacterium]|nr:hypothetical protein [bacterium]